MLFRSDKVHVPPVPLNVLTAPWPFAMWGIDMIGEIKPTASNGHRFILVAIDYFTKWVEAASYATVTKNVVARFIQHNLICRYGVPERIITDNGTVVPQNLPLQFSTRNHSFKRFLIFQTGSRIGQTDFSRQSDTLRVLLIFRALECFKQLA